MVSVQMVEKVVRDGMVAVLVSPGYGAGWSKWADDDKKLTALFDRRFVEAAEAGVKDIESVCEEVFGGDYMYTGGWRNIQVRWLPEGTVFIVEEYDGSENLRFVSDISITA